MINLTGTTLVNGEKSHSDNFNSVDLALPVDVLMGASVSRGRAYQALVRKLLYGYQRPSNPERKAWLKRERMKRFKARRFGIAECDCGNKAVGMLYGSWVCENCRELELSQRREQAEKNRKEKAQIYKYAWLKKRISLGYCGICNKKRGRWKWCCDACHEKELLRLRKWKRRNLAHNSRFSITAITGKHPWFKDKTIRTGNGKNYVRKEVL